VTHHFVMKRGTAAHLVPQLRCRAAEIAYHGMPVNSASRAAFADLQGIAVLLGSGGWFGRDIRAL